MGSVATLRFRRNAAQRHALAPLERQIRAADPHARRKYLRDFSAEFRGYEAVLKPEELFSLCATADILLVGDYHALARSQEFAAGLLGRVSAERPVVLGVETVFARDQAALDAWSRGELGEQQLRERIRFDLDWGYDWPPFFKLLEAARACHAPVFGLDCTPRDDMRRIAVRDRHAAEVIAGIRQGHPQATVVVLFGESHLASNHLPAQLRVRRPGDRLLTVLQNVDALYWRVAGELRQPVAGVRVREEAICVFNATPLEKYESYRLFLERWQQEKARHPDLVPAFMHLVEGLLRFLNVEKYSPSPTSGTQPRPWQGRMPEICLRPGAAWVRRRLRGRTAPGRAANAVLRELAQRGCCFVPELGAVLIDHFELSHGAEAAARAVRHLCRRPPRRTRLQRLEAPAEPVAQLSAEDRFYRAVVESALGDFGARALCPTRPAVRESDLLRLGQLSREAVAELRLGAYRGFVRMVNLLALHQHYEANLRRYRERPPRLAGLMTLEPERFEYATRWLGHRLGTELFDAYLSSRIPKRLLRALYFRDLSRPGAARTLYFSLQSRAAAPGRVAARANGKLSTRTSTALPGP